MAKIIKDMDGEITANRILEQFESQKDKKAAVSNIKLSADVYERYFADTKSADVAGIVEEALSAWFKEEKEAGVS